MWEDLKGVTLDPENEKERFYHLQSSFLCGSLRALVEIVTGLSWACMAFQISSMYSSTLFLDAGLNGFSRLGASHGLGLSQSFMSS